MSRQTRKPTATNWINSKAFFHDRRELVYERNTNATGIRANSCEGSRPATRNTSTQTPNRIISVSGVKSDDSEVPSSYSTIRRKPNTRSVERPTDINRLRNASEKIMSVMFQPVAP